MTKYAGLVVLAVCVLSGCQPSQERMPYSPIPGVTVLGLSVSGLEITRGADRQRLLSGVARSPTLRPEKVGLSFATYDGEGVESGMVVAYVDFSQATEAKFEMTVPPGCQGIRFVGGKAQAPR